MSTGGRDYGVTFAVGAKGTMRTPVQSNAEFVTTYWVGSGGLISGAPWKSHLGIVYTSTPTERGVSSFSCSHCSITGDVFERPDTVETFTAPDSEWVSTFDLDRPPVFIVAQVEHVGEHSDDPEDEPAGNAGYQAVLWLRDFFDVSQKAACSIAGVPEPTFYVWRNNPSSSVRSAGARRALKLRASLEVAIARMGVDAVRRFVTAGHPSIEDRLRRSSGAPWERAVSEIATYGTYELSSPLPRISSPDEYLRRVREVEDDAINPPRDSGARLMNESEIREAEQEGW